METFITFTTELTKLCCF